MAELLLQDARKLLGRVREQTDGVIVACSGGKDSLVALDLCHDVFERVEMFFLYFVRDLDCDEQFVRRAEKRYGITAHRFPSPLLATYLQSGFLARRGYRLRRAYKWADAEHAARERTGLEWIVSGMRMDESLQRRGMLKTRQGFWPEIKRVYPLWNWRAKQVLAYLRSRRIEIPTPLGSADAAGIGFADKTLAVLREKFPNDYEKIKRQFPFLATQEARNEWFGSEAEPVPEVRDEASPPAGADESAVQSPQD